MENALGIVLGFVLTTIIGGWWASRLQDRSWKQQNDVRLAEAEHERASAACQEVASLLDRRQYRMLRVLWAATPGENGSVDVVELERRRQAYLEVLFAWNDSLNTNLSLVGTYFGDESRKQLDGLYEDFKRVGKQVEEVIRAALAGDDTKARATHVAREFEAGRGASLNRRIYEFGLLLMGQLRDGEVGRARPRTAEKLGNAREINAQATP
jgi:hypothetical protein